jgi:ATP-dependent Clp protease protease subunit
MNKLFLLASMLFATSAFAAPASEAPTKPSGTVTLTKDNSIIFDQVVDAESTAKVVQRAQELDSKLKSTDPLYLVLNTPGGSIQDGLEMIQALQGLNRPIHTVTIFAASMGFQIVQGLGDRLVTPSGTLMAHKARGGFSGEFPGQIDSRYTYYIKRLNAMDKVTASRSRGKLTVKSLQALYENEYWVEGQDAVDAGLADKVVLGKCDHSLNGRRNTDFYFMGFVITLVQSECPMNQGILDVAIQISTDQGLMSLKDFQAKGGSFTGKTSNTYSSYSSSWDTIVGPPAPKTAAPVPTVDGLTIEKINAEVDNVKKNFRKRLAIVKE